MTRATARRKLMKLFPYYRVTTHNTRQFGCELWGFDRLAVRAQQLVCGVTWDEAFERFLKYESQRQEQILDAIGGPAVPPDLIVDPMSLHRSPG